MFILQGSVPVLTVQDSKNEKAKNQWLESLTQVRQQKDSEFKTSPTSPMAAVKRLTLERSQNQKTFVVEVNRKITLSQQKAPGAQFSLTNQEEKWRWERHHPGVTCTAADKPLTPGPLLNPGTRFQGDGWTISAYPSPDKLVLLVFDPLRPMIRHFSHLLYFPPDGKFAVPAVLEKFPKAERITMLTSQNLEKTFYRYAAVLFKLEGKKLRLTAFKSTLQGEDSTSLFIPFGDSTNGSATYGSGRFLEIPEPRAADFTLDFNLCFNPLCNYSPAYNCPLPPLENILTVPIKAGEKEYPH
jgi:uncharacterized protein (DUF1684 family)